MLWLLCESYCLKESPASQPKAQAGEYVKKIKDLRKKIENYDDELDVCVGLDVDADINVELLPEGFSLDDGETLDRPVVSLW